MLRWNERCCDVQVRRIANQLELDLKTYAKMVCTLLDIPVYDDPVESLHVLFTLYLEFKNNPIFRWGSRCRGSAAAGLGLRASRLCRRIRVLRDNA